MPLVGMMILTGGRFAGGRWKLHRNDARPMFSGDSKDSYSKPDGHYTLDKLSSIFITGNTTRDDAPNHIRVRRQVPREIAETWAWMCPAGAQEIPDDQPETGEVEVIANYTNCVQWGAITAKGGRLTPPGGRRRAAYQTPETLRTFPSPAIGSPRSSPPRGGATDCRSVPAVCDVLDTIERRNCSGLGIARTRSDPLR